MPGLSRRDSHELRVKDAFHGGGLRRPGYRYAGPERLPIGQSAPVQPAELLCHGPADAGQPDRVR